MTVPGPLTWTSTSEASLYLSITQSQPEHPGTTSFFSSDTGAGRREQEEIQSAVFPNQECLCVGSELNKHTAWSSPNAGTFTFP